METTVPLNQRIILIIIEYCGNEVNQMTQSKLSFYRYVSLIRSVINSIWLFEK